jgi:hypothetical protein
MEWGHLIASILVTCVILLVAAALSDAGRRAS